MAKKITHEQYVQWVSQNRPDYEVLESYQGTSTPILHRYIPLDLTWKVTPYEFKKGTSHPKLKLINKRIKSEKQYIQWLKDNRPEYQLIGEYQTSRKKVLHRHTETGLEWEVTPYDIKKGVNHSKLQKSNRWSHSQYVEWIKQHRPDYEVLEEYTTGDIKLLHRHIETGFSWKITPKSFKEGVECPELLKIRGVKTVGITHDQYVAWIKENRPDWIVKEQYVKDEVEILHQHIETGIEWKVSPKKFKRRTKPAPYEVLKATGRRIQYNNTQLYKKWISEYRPDYILIGEYTDLETPTLHSHIESGIDWLVKPRIFKQYNKPDSMDISLFKSKKNIRYTTEYYSKWIQQNRPEYELLDQYQGYNVPIVHRHIETKKTWKISPRRFKQGMDHPDLSSTTGRWTTNRYINWIQHNKPEYEVMEEYQGNNIPILHRHIETGTMWKVSPGNFKNGSSYPKRLNPIRRSKNKEEYYNWIKENRPDYRPLEDYQDSYVKILHEHIETGLKWYISPMCFKRGVHHPSLVPNGWSRVAIEWLQIMEEIHECRIQHMQNGGEVSLPGIGKVDGYCKETNTVYQFHGDFWHGNPLIYEAEDVNPINKVTYGELFDKTVEKDELIISKGYNLFVVWQQSFHEGELGTFFK